MNTNEIDETAADLAFAWKGTDPMHSEDEVRRAVAAADTTRDLTAGDVDVLMPVLCAKLRRDGTLV